MLVVRLFYLLPLFFGNRHRLLSGLILLACITLGSGCGDDFTPASQVEGLRVLAIRASAPSMLISDTTTLTALVYPETGVDYQWSVCLASAGSATAFECISADLECSLGTEPTAVLNVTTVAQACLDQGKAAAVMDQITGDEAPESVVIYARLRVSSGDDSIEAVKSVRIHQEPPLNINPALAGIKRDSMPWLDEPVVELPAKTSVTLTPMVAEDTRETYESIDGSQATEEFTFAWYATEGDLDKVFTYDDFPNNVLKTPTLPTGETEREGLLWLVVRDGRGGVDWILRRFVVRAAEVTP